MVDKEIKTNSKEGNEKDKDYRSRIRIIDRGIAYIFVYSEKSWKTINNSVAVPAICYIILISLSIFSLIIAAFIKESPLEGILTNIGYGVFCSSCVAALVDYGTTRRKKERDAYVYCIMTGRLKATVDLFVSLRLKLNSFLDLDSEVVSLEYYKWAAHFFIQKEDEIKEYKEIREILIGLCKKLLSNAEAIKEYSSVLAGNYSLKENFFAVLDDLIYCSRWIVEKNDINEYRFADLINSICEIYPQYSRVFKYHWDNNEAEKFHVEECMASLEQTLEFSKSERSAWH